MSIVDLVVLRLCTIDDDWMTGGAGPCQDDNDDTDDDAGRQTTTSSRIEYSGYRPNGSNNGDIVAAHSHKMSEEEQRRLASGNLAMVETNRAPVLRKLDRKAILKFVEAHKNYLRVFHDANAAGNPRSLVSMIETTFLESICDCDLAIDDKKAADVECQA